MMSCYCDEGLHGTSNPHRVLARRISDISWLSTSYDLWNVVDYLNSASIWHVFLNLFTGL
jgi:hypothetical protein